MLYTGPAGLVAHECILDLRDITAATGVTAEDVAKRLIDYGFHAPTLSFPVAGTLMVEPTESESLAELDRFCTAMIAIRDEIRRVETGEWTHDASPLASAPHPAEDVVADDWAHPYGRETAAFPLGAVGRQVLAAGEPDRRRVRRPQRRVLVRADRGLHGPVGRLTPWTESPYDAGTHPGVVEHRLLRGAGRRRRGAARPRSTTATGSSPSRCTPTATPTPSTRSASNRSAPPIPP